MTVIRAFFVSVIVLVSPVLGRPADQITAGPTKINVTLEQFAGLNPNPLEAKTTLLQQGVTVFQGPPTKLTTAILEQESLLSKADSTYTFLHEIFANLFQFKPIVDTIQESEKYGNDGEKFRSIGKAVVRTTEGLGNFLNTVIELPLDLFRKIAASANDKLNHLGGKIVGLE